MIIRGYDTDYSNYWVSGEIRFAGRKIQLFRIKDKSGIDVNDTDATGYFWAEITKEDAEYLNAPLDRFYELSIGRTDESIITVSKIFIDSISVSGLGVYLDFAVKVDDMTQEVK